MSEEMIDSLFAFLCRKYVQRADDRQAAMGLQYTQAETHDLAREIAAFVSAYNPNERLREALERIARDDYDPVVWDEGESFTEAAKQIAITALSPLPQGDDT